MASSSGPSPSHRFARVRGDHALETASDYVELVHDLISERGEARVSDVAERLGVSHVTVSKTIQRLQREGFVTALPYRSIFLTEAGRELADKSRAKHKIVLDFLVALGIPMEVAEIDAEGIEHHVSQDTLAAMEAFCRKARHGT